MDLSTEASFWREYALIYRNLEKARPYAGLARSLEALMEPSPGDLWLDVGCGPAKMSQLIWNKSQHTVRRIVGMDIVLSPAQDTLARDNSGLPLELVHADIGKRLPFADGEFDGVVANLVLPYVTEFEGSRGLGALRGTLAEMHRVLKPGGHFVWSTPRRDVRFEWVFVASLPDMLNPIPYVVQRDVTRILQAIKILRHALEIQRKGREGLYTFLPVCVAESLLGEIGFCRPTWRKAFARQVLVNRVYKS